MNTEEAAGKYLSLGYSIIPLRGSAYAKGTDDKERYRSGKKPLVESWTEFQNRPATFSEVAEWFRRWPKMSLGVITGPVSNVACIDCDTADAIETFRSLTPADYCTPTQNTPRGGKQFIVAYNAAVETKTALVPGMDTRGAGGYFIAAPSVNGSSAYNWLEGCEPWAVPPASLPLGFFDLLNKSSLAVKSLKEPSCISNAIFNDGRRDNDLFHVANCAIKGGLEVEYVREVLLRLVNSWGEHDPKWVEQKIKSALERTEKKDRNLAADVREWVMSTSGNFLSTEIYKGLQLSTRDEGKNLSIILKRLSEGKDRIIVKVGERNGSWRKIETDFEAMTIDLDAPDEEAAPLLLPFRLSEMVEIYPKNVIVVAGEKDAGKSCFALNTAYLNRKTMKVRYFNSEMGKTEISKRLRKFPYPWQDWKDIEFIERSSSFADFILPDGLNIVDFLEISDEHYKVVGWIKQMFDQLKTGILVVVLQKRSYKDFGAGGEGTLEKARLYLNLERGNVARIKSAKNWRTFNPRDYVCDYSIRNGGELSMIGDWRKVEDDPQPKKRTRYGEFVRETQN